MKTGLVAVLVSIAVSTGCHYQQRVNQELWERELRLQEDCIYRLKWELEDAQYSLSQAEEKIASLEQEVDTLRGSAQGGVPPVPETILGPTDDSAPRVPPAPSLPSIEPGEPFTPDKPMSYDDWPRSSNEASLKVAPASHAARDGLLERLNPDLEIDRITLDAARCGGLNTDGRPGDDMLSIVLKQHDEAGRPVLAPGDLSIVVVDPALEGDSARIAQWEFESADVERHVLRNRDGGAICYELPWPTPPSHRDLRLFVRFATYDGRRLEADLPIEVQLAEEASEQVETLASREPATLSAADGGNPADENHSPQHAEPAQSPTSANPHSSATAKKPRWAPYR